MRILSFDPGQMTGVAVLDTEGNLDFAMAVTTMALQEPSFLLHVGALARADLVVVEKPPPYIHSDPAVQNYHLICAWYEKQGYEVQRVNPGQWKGMTKDIRIPATHQNDAATMAAWVRRNALGS